MSTKVAKIFIFFVPPPPLNVENSNPPPFKKTRPPMLSTCALPDTTYITFYLQLYFHREILDQIDDFQGHWKISWLPPKRDEDLWWHRSAVFEELQWRNHNGNNHNSQHWVHFAAELIVDWVFRVVDSQWDCDKCNSDDSLQNCSGLSSWSFWNQLTRHNYT